MSQQHGDERHEPVDSIGPTGLLGYEINVAWTDLILLVPAMLAGMWISQFAARLSFVSDIASLVAIPLCVGVTGLYIFMVRDQPVPPHQVLVRSVQFWRSDKEISVDDDVGETEPSDLTGVEQVHLNRGGIEREDKSLVGSVEVNPSPMGVSTDAEWERATREYREHLASVEYPTVTSVRGHPVSPEILTEGLEDRLTDEDVERVPELESIIKTHLERWPAEFRERGTSVRQHRVAIPVTPTDAKLDDRNGLDRLGQIPVVGGGLRELSGDFVSRDERAVKEDQGGLLGGRLNEMASTFDALPGCDARPLSAAEFGEEIEAYWNNRMTHELHDELAEESRFLTDPPMKKGGPIDTGDLPDTELMDDQVDDMEVDDE